MNLLFRGEQILNGPVGTTNHQLAELPGLFIVHHTLIRLTQAIAGSGSLTMRLGTSSAGTQWLLASASRDLTTPVGTVQGTALADYGADLSAAPYWKAYTSGLQSVYLGVTRSTDEVGITAGKVVVEIYGVPICAPARSLREPSPPRSSSRSTANRPTHRETRLGSHMPHASPSRDVPMDMRTVAPADADLPNGIASGLLASADCTVEIVTYGGTTLTSVPLKAGLPFFMGIKRVKTISTGTVWALYH